MRGTLRVGTSGWSYDPWEGPFYPEGTGSDERFAFYAERFDTVEINNTFYQLPEEETVATRRDRAPDGFTYAVKASRYLTHIKKRNDPDQPLRRRHGAPLCIYDDAGTVAPKDVTADFVYLRFHGTEEGYRGACGAEGIAPWAGAVHAWLEAGTNVYAYCNNDADISAPDDARTLRHMLES